MTEVAIPTKYILFSHYAAHESGDFEAFTKLGTHPIDLPGVRFLIEHLRGLRELLTSPGHEGLLVLFYASGYEDFLNGLVHGKDDEVLRSESPQLLFAEAVARVVRETLEKVGLQDRVRFLTSFDLRVVLGRANAILAGQFQAFFIGPARGVRYDAPKIVEAILRLRVLGNGVPVLRLDHDVIFRGVNRGIGDLGLFKAVACALRAYQLRVAETTVSTFLFSASYNSRALLHPTEDTTPFEAWSRAFATRVYPALVADPTDVLSVSLRPEAEHNAAWEEYVKSHLDDGLARAFYGLKETTGSLLVGGVSGLAIIGAHPLHSVISGALLCLSEGAILDLPPFSNFRMNVMWIDDHLKYSLHRAMHHFTSGETLDLEPGLSDARMDDVMVTKARPPVRNLPTYIFDVYLPTLLWGTIVDSWITSHPILKYRVESLQPDERDLWRLATGSQQEAPLPKAMLETLRVGSFDPNAVQMLRTAFVTSAVKRIQEVRSLWATLRADNLRTFASYWAEGSVEREFGGELFEKCDDKLWQGIAPDRPLGQPIAGLEDLSAAMALKVTDLIDDTVSYVHWTLQWPRFVQIVRSIRQGDFVGDLNWRFR